MDIKKLFKFRNAPCGICEDMLLLFLMSFCYSAVCCENYMPVSFMKVYKAVISLFFAGCWLCVMFKNGSRGRWQLLLFSGLFWFLPQLLIFLANDGPRVFRMSVLMYVLSEFSVFISSVPGTLAGNLFGMEEFAGVAASFIMTVVIYFAGVGFAVLSKKNNKAKALNEHGHGPEPESAPDSVPVAGTRFKPTSEYSGHNDD